MKGETFEKLQLSSHLPHQSKEREERKHVRVVGKCKFRSFFSFFLFIFSRMNSEQNVRQIFI